MENPDVPRDGGAADPPRPPRRAGGDRRRRPLPRLRRRQHGHRPDDRRGWRVDGRIAMKAGQYNQAIDPVNPPLNTSTAQWSIRSTPRCTEAIIEAAGRLRRPGCRRLPRDRSPACWPARGALRRRRRASPTVEPAQRSPRRPPERMTEPAGRQLGTPPRSSCHLAIPKSV